MPSTGKAGLDFQYRAPMGDTTFQVQGQAMVAQYDMNVPRPAANEAPTTLLSQPNLTQNVLQGNQYSINIGGGELMASVGDKPWEFAGRFAMVIPDVNMLGTYAQRNGSTPVTFTGGALGAGKTTALVAPIFTSSDPIYEITFPSITWHMNGDCKIVAETIFMIDTPAVKSDDGTYLIAEMPGSANSGVGNFAAGPNDGANFRIGLVPIGRMMVQLQF